MKNRVISITIVAILLIVIIVTVYTTFKKDTTNVVIPKDSKVEDIVFDKKKVNIYFFWGRGCPHCEELFQFLEDTKGQYGKYYNIYCFEVWNNQDNAQRMDEFADALNDKVGRSVPYLIIGDQSFQGYNATMNKDILNTILKKAKQENPDDVYQTIKNNQ